MKYKIGIDVGGTFTDFLLCFPDGSSRIYKLLSTPDDPSIATMAGLRDMAADLNMTPRDFLQQVEVIVHGTTVTTNAVLTLSGAKTGMVTTSGVRDALEMRRGIREEQYNNHYENAKPLVRRYLRRPVRGRLDYQGQPLEPLVLDDVVAAAEIFQAEGVEAIAVCFMNSFANADHENTAAKLLAELQPGAYLSVSSELLPSIRFYDRISTTVLNAYVGPILKRYLDALVGRLAAEDFPGVLLIMQSNGGVISPQAAISQAAATLLSGPAGGPVAGIAYSGVQGYRDCLTIDMGGTSFDAALVKDQQPVVTTVGEINRYRLALPMLHVVTIGAGGGSIGWIDEGGLLRMGPQSAGSKPGPACYNLGGQLPTCTDADLLLGYLDPDFFAGGRMPLSFKKAYEAIEEKIAKPLGLDPFEAAMGMYNVINVNMAAAVREVSISQGYDPRDFPLVVAGGAGPNHAGMIAHELEIPIMIIPRESSIFCAAGMLISDLKHDYVRTYPARLDQADGRIFKDKFAEMLQQGLSMLATEHIPAEQVRVVYSLDLRYVKQYHEVNVTVTREEIDRLDFPAMAARFHPAHNALFGYSLEEQGTPVELINMRLVCIGETDKPKFIEQAYAGEDPGPAYKKSRQVYRPITKKFEMVDVFDGLALRFGQRIVGPALIEQVNTTAFVPGGYNVMVDKFGSYTMYLKSKEAEVRERIWS